jgi:hypothetical protein
MGRDILAGLPARSTTPVPGQWLLDLPSLSPFIHIRRYRLVQPVTPGGPSGLIPSSVRNDALERTWKQVNGSEIGYTNGVAGVLEGGCATVLSSPEGRTLWCFHVEKDGDTPDTSTIDMTGIEGL